MFTNDCVTPYTLVGWWVAALIESRTAVNKKRADMIRGRSSSYQRLICSGADNKLGQTMAQIQFAVGASAACA